MSEPLPPVAAGDPTPPPAPPPEVPTTAPPVAGDSPPASGVPPWAPAPMGYLRRRHWRGWWLPGLVGLLVGLLIGCGGGLLVTQVWDHGVLAAHSRIHDGRFGPGHFGPGGPRFGRPGFGRPGVPGGVAPPLRPTAPPSPS